MATSDWVSLVFVVCIIALQVAAEQREVVLCQIIRTKCGSARSLWRWRAALALVGDIRYLSHMVLVCTVSGLVLYRGSDALSICLNALAVLFVFEADSIIYSYGFSDRLKESFEVGLKVLSLDSRDEARLEAMRAAQLVLAPLFCIGIILLFGRCADQNVNHSVLISTLAVVPPVVEVAFGAHGNARPEKFLLRTCRQLAGVLLVTVLASLVPRIDRGHFDWPSTTSDIFVADPLQP
uniref:Protein RFT1 homolog n=1 Tax=Haptolina ericina TaxID=156174 RepID=A0A7S3BPC4_9EUKA